MPKRAFAICAHPDDIEFTMAGTLILLGKAGYELHYMTVANGSCGTNQFDRETIIQIRGEESRNAAAFINAVYHEPLVDDIGIFYERQTLARLSSIVRSVAPEIILTHSPNEYMEDHSNTCRLVQTAAFARGMPNYIVNPHRPPVEQPVTVYHSLPFGGLDPLGRPVNPDIYVDTNSVIDQKKEMLALHNSQKEWLDRSQGMDFYLHTMMDGSRAVGEKSGHFIHAESWIKHLHIGYCDENADPLSTALNDFVYKP